MVTRTPHRLVPDGRRVIARAFVPGDERSADGRHRAEVIIDRILTMTGAEVDCVLAGLAEEFASRHRNYDQLLEHNFQLVAPYLNGAQPLSKQRRLLIGAYFTQEYAIEAAGLSNPSIVPAPDQSDLASGEQRFIMSVRAVGEGHVSSIEFRSGIVDADGEISLDPTASCATTGSRKSPFYEKHHFTAKLAEFGADNHVSALAMRHLSERFDSDDLDRAVDRLTHSDVVPPTIAYETIRIIRSLAASNYVVAFPHDTVLSERVLFPTGPNEIRGMEDARFVRFVNRNGSVTYYATYTAYDGFEIFPQLIETENFLSFRISTLNGTCVRNKGMALFPRQIDGKYFMLSRFDRENTHLMTSDDVHTWSHTEVLRTPTRPWELVQIGNCGSPIETEIGWLVLTHGVGPMRRYAIGALLLDLDDPRRVIAHLPEPLIVANDQERDGYVPNVVYSCGALLHGGNLVLPYGFSDYGTTIALVALDALLALLLERGTS